MKKDNDSKVEKITDQTKGNDPDVEIERKQFRTLILSNPNYFGNLKASTLKAVKSIQSNTTYEELKCVGLNPPYNRLEAVIHIKRSNGYGGEICSTGTTEYVRFYVDLFDNGVWHDVGVTKVQVHDIPGNKPLCYAVRHDFDAIRKFCFFENIVKVRAILQWNTPPPPNTPDYNPVWGNVQEVQVQIHPFKFWLLGDLVAEIEKVKVIPDSIGPIIKQLDPAVKLTVAETQSLSLVQKKKLYANQNVPVHRFAFQEAQQLLSLSATTSFASASKASLVDLGLTVAELNDLVVKLFPTDGDTSFEELRCVGLYPENDLLEAVLTVKKAAGYSGRLCGNGSTEYVAFWIDFNDGGGFQYMGTSTVNVHDLQTIPREDVQYAVFLKKDLSKFRVPCQKGPRVVKVRAILSWETAPPPGNPNFVPTWGNREECLVQLQPSKVEGHAPLIETVGDIGVDDINQFTGLATGHGQIGGFAVNESPFGGTVTITGRIGDPPDSFNGGAAPFKYRIEVFGPAPFNSWQPLTNPIKVKISEWFAGIPQDCALGEVVCNVTLTPNDDGDGLGPGWYEYLEDTKGLNQRFLVVDKLASWATNANMEGLWFIRITAKNPVGPVVFPGTQLIRVRIDNTAPSGPAGPGATQAEIEANPPLTITGATFNGSSIPATGCGQFPVGTILEGKYKVHDPGTSSPNQHFGGFNLNVIPDGPSHDVKPSPEGGSFPAVSTTGVDGTWTLDTSNMDPCGYVIRLSASDRTNVNSVGQGFSMFYDVGFCLRAAPAVKP
ncbi:MAG TPA: hypothetical protein VFI24_12040 [Pyrinomonadaceae bacterium]|nr:hypothetical protein [Pyrinomonadaceae bacterium]